MFKLRFYFITFNLISQILLFNYGVQSSYIPRENVEKSNDIQMIAALFRHGDRSPLRSYPTDPHLHHYWPGGFGALSQKGALQHYTLGKKLKARYQHLLPKDGFYSKNDIQVTSSIVERCLMSAQSLLAGFMPPSNGKNLLPINWQPIPVITAPQNMDNMLAQYKPCKKYDQEKEYLQNNPPEDVQRMNKENEELYRILTKYSGKNVTTTTDIKNFYDIFTIHQDYGLELPEWVKSIFPGKMKEIAERDFILVSETPYMQKVKGGPFITEIYEKMLQKEENLLKPNRKIFLYSAHDITLTNVMNALNIIDQTTAIPDYASILIFELHKNPKIQNDLEVKLYYYHNSAVNIPKEIFIPNCGNPCTFEKFGNVIQSLLIDNFDELCENN